MLARVSRCNSCAIQLAFQGHLKGVLICWCWGWNPGPYVHWASALLLSQIIISHAASTMAPSRAFTTPPLPWTSMSPLCPPASTSHQSAFCPCSPDILVTRLRRHVASGVPSVPECHAFKLHCVIACRCCTPGHCRTVPPRRQPVLAGRSARPRTGRCTGCSPSVRFRPWSVARPWPPSHRLVVLLCHL